MMNSNDNILAKVRLIGRKEIVEKVLNIQPQTGCHLFFFEGGGGIGKTHLLNDLLTKLHNPDQSPWVIQNVIDLYHINTHSAEGFAESIVAMFPSETPAFLEYQKTRWKLEKARAAGQIEIASEQLANLLENCSEGLRKISAERGLVFAIDTAERWVYRIDENEIQTSQAWNWLLTWLDKLPHALVMIAGREPINILASQVSALKPNWTSLSNFELEQTREYVEEISSLSTGNPLQIDAEDINRVHQLSKGRPILLSLYLHFYLTNSGKAKTLLEKETENEFKEALVNNLLLLPDLVDVLPAMGRTPKGMDISLLKRFMQNSNEDVERKFETLKEYAFVKTFEGSDRLFLHEEMYSLLKQVIYSKPQDPVDQDAASEIIEVYYDTGLLELSNELQEVYKGKFREEALDLEMAERTVQAYHDSGLDELGRVLGEIFDNKLEMQKSVDVVVDRIRDLERKRHILYGDIIYYRLRYKTASGLRRYYRYIHQATLHGESDLLQLLRSELLEYLGKIDITHQQDQEQLPFTRGLLASVTVLEAVATRMGNRFEKVKQANLEIERIPELTNAEKNILKALLLPWASVTQVFSGDYAGAKRTLMESIDLLTQASTKSGDWRDWFFNVGMAFAHRQLGYLFRVQGEIEKAISEYVNSLKFVREANFLLEEATLRNDLGFAKAELGDFQNAKRDIQLGLKERYALADGRQIALSLSTLAQCALREGSFDDAMNAAIRAKQIAEMLEDNRSLGLATLGLTEAKRRIARSDEALSFRTRKKLLSDALILSTEALGIFTRVVPEEARAIEARIEEGCAARDLIYILVQEPSIADYSIEQLKETADNAFLEAQRLASKQNVIYRKIDALVNRAWLAYYYGDKSFQKTAIADANAAFDPRYRFKLGGNIDIPLSEANRILWSQLGKLHVCKGHIAFDGWLSTSNLEQLRLAAEDYLLGLEYSNLFSGNHRGLQQGRDGIFFKLYDLSKDSLREFASAVILVEEKYKITTPSYLQNLLGEGGLWYQS